MEWLGLAAALGLAGFSFRYTWWRPPRKGVPILQYHRIGPDTGPVSSSRLQIPAAVFARQLDTLRGLGYQAVTLSQALGERPPRKPVVLTFDDGYADFYYQAWSLLKERGMTATVFLVTGALDGEVHWYRDQGEQPLPMLTRLQVRELFAQGVEFGGHSHRHRDLTTLDDRGLMHEITGCQKVLTDLLGRPARVFAYPYGRANGLAAQAVRRAGFISACTMTPGLLNKKCKRLSLPRIPINAKDNRLDFRLKLSRSRSRISNGTKK
jgi:peptidoglycan/xylan/chitin deacetylase (PgdA/CDA1 family)